MCCYEQGVRFVAALLVSALLACDAPAAPADRVTTLREAADDVIAPGYAAAADRATALRDATHALCAAPGTSALASAQAAWLDAVTSWRRTRTFALRYEPTIASTLEGELTTAVDAPGLEAIVTGTDAIDAPDYVAALGGAHKGYFAIEYLLFAYPAFDARDDARTLAALGDPRRCTLLDLLAADAASVTARARDVWSPTAGDFGATFASETSNATYPSSLQAMDDLVSGVANAIDGLRDRSIGRPLGVTVHASPPESPYAGASVALMRATLAGVHDLWTHPSHGLDALLRDRDEAVADEVIAQMETARLAIEALASPPLAVPWERYVTGTDRDAGNAAYDALATLESTLATEVGTTLGLSVTIMVDGD